MNTPQSTIDDGDPKQPAILVIEDDLTNLKLLANYLTEHNYRVSIARDGEAGLKRVKLTKPDIILMDVQMPGIDGFEACKRLKEDDETKNIPVIFMTALSQLEDKVRGFEVGAVDYVTKPIQLTELVMRLNTHLSLQILQQTLQAQNNQLAKEIADRIETEAALKQANEKISRLNTRLQSENLRLEAEVDVARQIQQMLLPSAEELYELADLDIAALTLPANEVGGDYYDVLHHEGRIKLGIGDVTGHGLESGIVMLMLQTVIRALLVSDITDVKQFWGVVNETIHRNVQRMGLRKNLSLTLLDYIPPPAAAAAAQLRISGQHERVIVVRGNANVDVVDTLNLGFPVGMIDQITEFVDEQTIALQSGDGIVLYTDGLTEAIDSAGEQYTLDRLCKMASQYWHRTTVAEIKEALLADVRTHIGQQPLLDDLTLVIVKRK